MAEKKNSENKDTQTVSSSISPLANVGKLTPIQTPVTKTGDKGSSKAGGK